MNIKEAKEEICRTVTAYQARTEAGLYRIPSEKKRPILLIGAPGIGKTAIVEQAAAECGISFLSYTMTHHTRQSAVGLPLLKEKTFQGKACTVTEYTMSEIIGRVMELMEEGGQEEGILFLDEINCVSETLMPAMLQFLQFKTFGCHRLPEGWIIVAAGNPPRYNRSAREFDVVTLDRVKYMELEASFDSWKEYALSRNLHSAILSYLTMKPEQLYVFRRTETGKEFVTPRGWEDLSQILETYEDLGLPVEDALFSQYLQCRETALDFLSYYRLSRRLLASPVLETLTRDGTLPEDAPSSSEWSGLSFDERLCVTEHLLHSIRRQVRSYENRRQLIQSLSYFAEGLAAQHPDFSGLEQVCAGLLAKRKASLQKRKEFGLLDRREEERERLLADTVRQYASRVRLSHFSDTRNEPAPDSAVSAMTSLIRADMDELEQDALRLERVLRGTSEFIDTRFGDSPEAFLFFTELTEQEDTGRFLSVRMGDLKDRILQMTARD